MKSVIIVALALFNLPGIALAGSAPVIPPSIPPIEIEPPAVTPPPVVVEPPPAAPPSPITRSSSQRSGVGTFPEVLQNFVRNNPNSLLTGLVPNGNRNGTPLPIEEVKSNVIRNLTSRGIINGANDPQIIFNQFPPFGGTIVSPSNLGQVPPIVIPPINF